ncbi:MAG TPA: 4Fe-4S dicluster domain-containing protein [Candidatus Krumholzibacteria bacterium]|nr:4Fe-4S dicluster domain-containing protein [Candidatus Krumholzibacteria bacterium]HPD73207.1 4Fe-4S dicluster domain-containing protein [Candidatus Krumholzibacteria bacterium]HRY40169.1 4Fe-4S dicluster domain-containing protein [Candidatus Krumholzibacteria bacterium]
MDTLQTFASAKLAAGEVKIVIGYQAGSDATRARPAFVSDTAEAASLIYDDRCRQNLAVYLLKPEVRAAGRAAVVCGPATLRTLLQYAAENRIAADAVVAIAVDADGTVTELADLEAVETHVARQPRGLTPEQQAEIDRIDALPLGERWQWWSRELGRCFKCYACRAACPLCYCSRCITDVNQPQWIPVAADPLGNLEWNVVRAMHLAGRCVDCGSCAEACPQGIRIDLLNRVLAREAVVDFGVAAGVSRRKDYALASFKPDDKEEFIR